MKRYSVLLSVIALSLAGSAAQAQNSLNLQNPGISTTPGVTQPVSPTPVNTSSSVADFRTLQSINPNQASNGNPTNPLGFSSINTSAPVVLPSRFGTSNVLSTQSPQPTVAQPLPQAPSITSTSNSITPAAAAFTFTPSQNFQRIVTPTPFVPPSRRR